MDRHRSSIPENQVPYSSSDQSDQVRQEVNPKKDLPAGQVDIIAMVRSLQRTAGITDCFRRGHSDCDILDCDWRSFCMGTPIDRKKSGKPPR